MQLGTELQPLASSSSEITLQKAAREGRLNVVQDRLEQFKTHCICGTRRTGTEIRCPSCRVAKVNAKDQDGFTALHYAAKYASKYGEPHLEILLKLIENGGDCKIVTDVDDYTALHLVAQQASQANCEATMEVLLEECPSSRYINRKAHCGSTALHLACSRGNTAAVDCLLKQRGIDLNIRNANGDTVLHEACTTENTDILEMLLEELGKNKKLLATLLTTHNSSSLTPLHLACRYGRTQVAKMLLEKVDEPMKVQALAERDSTCSTPIFLACKSDEESVVEELLEIDGIDLAYQRNDGAEGGDGATILHILAQLGWCRAATKAIDKEKEPSLLSLPDKSGKTPLHYVAAQSTSEKQKEMIKLFLGRGAVIDARCKEERTPLLLAAKIGNQTAFDLLKEKAKLTEVDCDEKNAVHLAAESDSKSILVFLKGSLESLDSLDLFGKPDRIGNTPLHLAAAKGLMTPLEYLLDDIKVEVDRCNHSDRTPLHLAAEEGHSEAVQKLLDECSMSSKQDENLNTPLHIAAMKGHLEAAEILVKHDSSGVSARNDIRWTPLHCAAYSGDHDQIVELMIEYNAKIDSKDKLKMTPLHLAALKGHLKVVQILLRRKADIKAKNKDGYNALDLAIDNGHTEVASAIVNDPRWKDALRNQTKRHNEKTTPMRKLIRKMPDVALEVFEHCTTCNATLDCKIRPDSSEYTITFDYEFLEDFGKDWRDGGGFEKSKHPLQIMVDSNQIKLFDHPLVVNLLAFKWSRALVLYLANVVFYIFFLCFLTAFALLLPNPLSEICKSITNGSFGSARDSETCVDNNLTDIECGKCALQKFELGYRYFFGALVFLCVAIRLIMEVFQIFLGSLGYLTSYENWVELLLYLCSIVFLSTVGMPCLCPASWQWQFGALTVFLAWMELAIFVRKLPFVGIYVVMFVNILKTFAKIVTPIFVLVLAFSIAFYMTFFIPNVLFAASPFATPVLAIIKTMTMSAGDLDFNSIYRLTPGGVGAIDEVPESIPYPPVSYLLWIVFITLMPVLLSNLLTSLAVDDVSQIRAKAEYQKLALKVDLVLSMEQAFSFLRTLFVPDKLQIVVAPNKDFTPMQKFRSAILEENIQNVNYTPTEPIEQLLQQHTMGIMAELAKLAEQIKKASPDEKEED